MKRALGAVAAIWLGGCGDNSKLCGKGTDDLDNDGECEPSDGDGNIRCGDGTRLDPVTMDCVPDPLACSGGTVLVNHRCQDPSAGLDIDLEEGPEPNAFETGAVPAGLITLEAVGSDGFVVHGCIKPIDDATPDFDVFLLDVAAPTLIELTADGVLGLDAGFEITSTVPALASWRRFGINLATDVSHRQVWLPAAGTYRVTMSDSRTFLPVVDGANAMPAPAGNTDGTSCYFVTIDQKTPAPVVLDRATGDTGTIADAIKFYTGSGLASNTRIRTTIMSTHAQPALVVTNGTTLVGFDDDGDMMFDGSGSPLIAGDFVYNYALFSTPYQLTVQ